MKTKLAILFTMLGTLIVLAIPSVASAHQCYSYCDALYFSNGGVVWCGQAHDGDLVRDPSDGAGYLCDHYFGGGHVHYYWVGGF